MKLSPFDRALNRVVRAELSRPGDDLPDISVVMQAFEQDAIAYSKSHFHARTLATTLAKLVVALALAIVVYVIAIMVFDPSADKAHVEAPTLAPNATAMPDLSLPGLMGYEMVDAGHQLDVTDMADLQYYFMLPVGVLDSPGWSVSRMYLRDERGVDGLQTRTASVVYTNATGDTATVSSHLPGSEAALRLEDQMHYDGTTKMLGLDAAKLSGNGLSRVYTLMSRAAYSIESTLPIDAVAKLADDVKMNEQSE